jgi:hypothetical protein
MKKKTKIILWCLSIFFLLGALGCLPKTLLAAFFLFLAGISCNPLFLDYLVKIGKNPPKIVKIVITFVLFMIGGSMIPSVQDTTIPIETTTEQITANIVEKQVKNISETTITIPSSEEITTEQTVSDVESSLSDIDLEEQILVESGVSETTIKETTTIEEVTTVEEIVEETTIEETTTQETVPPTTEVQTTQEEIPTEIIVHITRTGSKYHRSGCQYLRKSDISISLDDAKNRGYSPCSKCNPPR